MNYFIKISIMQKMKTNVIDAANDRIDLLWQKISGLIISRNSEVDCPSRSWDLTPLNNFSGPHNPQLISELKLFVLLALIMSICH